MNKTQPPTPEGKKQTTKKSLFIAVSILILVAVGGMAFTLFLTSNNAQHIAQPLEKVLLASGADKKCTLGDGGHGPDNSQPWYTAYFEVPKDQTQAESLIKQVAHNEGYALAKAGTGVKGYLGDIVYVDKSSHKNVELALALTNSGALHACPGQVFNDATHTAISLEVKVSGE